MFAIKSFFLVATLVELSTQMGPAMTWPVSFSGAYDQEVAVQLGAYPCNFFFPPREPYAENNIPLGEEQKMEFSEAVSVYTGSCQLGLTTDVPPTENSTWKTLYSIEGGCGPDSSFKNFTIPNDVAPGNYSLASSFLPSEGQFMYMYCAPITTVESSIHLPTKDEREMRDIDLIDRSDLPEMFWGSRNFLDTTCLPPHGKSLAYPDPGRYVERRVDDTELSLPTECPE